MTAKETFSTRNTDSKISVDAIKQTLMILQDYHKNLQSANMAIELWMAAKGFPPKEGGRLLIPVDYATDNNIHESFLPAYVRISPLVKDFTLIMAPNIGGY